MNGPHSPRKLYHVGVEQLGFQKKRHQDWFDENDVEIANIIAEKNSAHNNYICRPTRASKQKLKLKQQAQRFIREVKDKWWETNARDIQRYADEGRKQAFYESIKKVSGPVSLTGLF